MILKILDKSLKVSDNNIKSSPSLAVKSSNLRYLLRVSDLRYKIVLLKPSHAIGEVKIA